MTYFSQIKLGNLTNPYRKYGPHHKKSFFHAQLSVKFIMFLNDTVTCWHFNIFSLIITTSESSKERNFQHFKYDHWQLFGKFLIALLLLIIASPPRPLGKICFKLVLNVLINSKTIFDNGAMINDQLKAINTLTASSSFTKWYYVVRDAG